MKEMRAALYKEDNGEYIIENVELIEPNANEVLVKVIASGMCHTDEFGKGIGLPLPIVFGHEGAGIVEKVGENVKDIEVGDHVAFSYAYCGYCKNCISGMPQYCEHFNDINFGGVGADGKTKLFQNGKPLSMFFGQSSFATYSTINASSVVKVDKDVDLSIIAPMSCGIQTGAGAVLNTLKPSMDESIVVFGCGAVGMSAIMASKVARCKRIIAVARKEKDLILAKELGATDVVDSSKVENVAETLKELTNGGVDYAIDTTGNGNMILNAIKLTKYNGTIIPLAPSGVIENFNIGQDVLMEMRTIKGINQGDSIPKVFIPRLVRLYKEGLFPLDKIITKYSFDDIGKAKEDKDTGKCIKAVLVMSDK
ncbi:MAG: NAD(P)-dependent alcohol dehydrogenase [Bacilli bacterium]|nr:NAD(P)-dependent alcohol dehydrogenase [Bacilli bacterium]